MTHPNLDTLVNVPLELFDAVEVHPVMEWDGNCESLHPSDLENYRSRYPEAEFFWSVYLHYDATNPANKGFGGIECVADFPCEASANEFADGLEKSLQIIKAKG